MRRGVEVISNAHTAQVLVDPMRREMVRLLAEGAKTENELAKTLGLSNPSVGHHLKVLKDSGLIRLVRQEVEEHGILQKFYEANAQVYFIDSGKMPLAIERYFMPISLERARGIMASVSAIFRQPSHVPAEDMEKFATALVSAVVAIAPKFSKRWNAEREELINKLYGDALTYVLRRRKLLPESIRIPLTITDKIRIQMGKA